MRYRPEHKAEVRQRIVQDASRRIRAEGMGGAAVASVMRDTGLTHGGFYKHFESKDELLMESLQAGFREIEDRLVEVAEKAPPGTAWRAIVKYYLSPQHCDSIATGCPMVALAPELSRMEPATRPQIVAELLAYKNRMVPYMPGRRAADRERAFFAIFSTMIGAVEIARILPDPAARNTILGNARDFLLKNF